MAEAWDIGAYQLGRSFPGLTWRQWNGQYRDDAARVCQGRCRQGRRVDAPVVRQRRFVSRRPLIDVCRPYQSVNFITATMAFVSTIWSPTTTNTTRRTATTTRDGTDDNLSWNCGWEGDEDVPRGGAARCAGSRSRISCALLMLSERHADVLRRRRVPEHAARQQQPVQSGQRNHVAGLGSCSIATATCFASSSR